MWNSGAIANCPTEIRRDRLRLSPLDACRSKKENSMKLTTLFAATAVAGTLGFGAAALGYYVGKQL